AWNDVLKPLGITTDELRAAPEGVRLPLKHSYRKYARGGSTCQGFSTETGRVEFYSEKLRRHGYPALPMLTPTSAPEAAFPLILTTAKNGCYCHSQHRDISALRRRWPVPVVALPTAFAQARQVVDGDRVEIRTSDGCAIMRARIDPDLAENVAVADYGWWQACPDLGLDGSSVDGATTANFNALVSECVIDPVSAAPAMRSLRCDIVPLLGQVAPWAAVRSLRVEAVEPEADGVVKITLAAADKSILPAFAAGQFLTLACNEAAARRGEVRSYSLCGATAPQPTSYRIGVKKLKGGAISPRLVDELRVGDCLYSMAPAGRFLLPRSNEFPIVLIAGGIGITPFMGYLETLALWDRRPDVHLHYVVPNRRGHAFAERIAALACQMPELRVTTCYTRPDDGEIEGIHFDRRGRLTLGMMDEALVARRARFYMCGPDVMMETMRQALLQAGVPSFEIFQERFVSPQPSAQAAADSSQQVLFKRSGLELEWGAGSGSLLDLAERHGVRIPTGCRVGQCESCVVGLLEG
ncbi:molybdopterin dinucleotide binding domain-containing protein, partial [Bradyrhizobium sp.]|uniref:molybdopterin dinucleotide binding domain-containing protein n=1 Tax=Bradyrhizobium sp. TaxID=376 RepID=UPI003C5D9D97